jgi:GNAT superfamily N-acetyltransferase
MALIRIAAPRESEALMRLINAAFVVERFFIDVDRVRIDEVRELQETGVFLVAGEMEACVYVEARGERGYFGLLSVDPARQGNGLGRALVDAAEQYCRDRGCRWMDLRVVSVREELPGFYRKLGYVESGTEPFESDYPTKLPVHLVKMQKRLSAPPKAGTDSR